MGKSFIEEAQKGIISWYPFVEKTKILVIEDQSSSISTELSDKGFDVDIESVRNSAKSIFLQEHKNYYDYCIVISLLETCFEPVEMLKRWWSVLNCDGKLLLGMNNRLGLRYFAGDKDPYLNTCFECVEGYSSRNTKDIKSMGGRMYSAQEIRKILQEAAICNSKFWSVFPTLEQPQLIYSEDYVPSESMSMRYMPMYRNPESIFLNEAYCYDGLIQNGLFFTLANNYFIECRKEGQPCDVRHVTMSMDRGEKNACITIIHENYVEKRPLYKEGKQRLQTLVENTKKLIERKIPMVPMEQKEDSVILPFVNSITGDVYMQRLLEEDVDEFIKRMDELRDYIFNSSEQSGVTELGVILKYGYIDLVPLNSFYIEGKGWQFFDQEFYYKNLPANAILHRAISIIYEGLPERISILSPDFFYERYKLKEHLDEWPLYSSKFTNELRNYESLFTYNSCFERNWTILFENRNSISKGAIANILERKSCFDGADKEKLYIFGTGKYGDKFIQWYGCEYQIAAVVDNNQNKWDTIFNGFKVENPDILRKQKDGRIIICTASYMNIVKQLLKKEIPLERIYLYQANKVYEGRKKQGLLAKAISERFNEGKKKYTVGYISGTFDLFHYGHVRLLKRAKEMCDYLIVTVTSDQYIRDVKKKEPIIDEQGRLEVVKSCRYVDEATIIPMKYNGTIDAYQKYHFDVQICGSDAQNNPWWLEQKEWLEKQGSDLIFLSYTESTSSSKIRSKMQREANINE